MADKRIVPEPLIYDRQGDSTVLRPQAQPTDNFVRAAEPIKSPMWDVAAALAEVNPKINKWIDDKGRQAAHEDSRAAEAKAMQSQAKTWQEAIDKGEVSPGQSPLYQRVFEETIGKNSALSSAQAELTKRWYASDNALRNSQDPEAMNKWFAENTTEMLKGKSDDYIKGFVPTLNQVKQNLVQKWIAENVQNLEEDNKIAFGTLRRNRILSMVKTSSPEQIAEALASDAIPQQFAGLKRKDINKIDAQALIDVATSTGNANILKIGFADRPDVKNPGQTIPGVFNIPGFSQHAQQAETAILHKAQVQESRGLTAQAHAREEGLRVFLKELADKRVADPSYQPTAEDLSKAQGFSTHGAAAAHGMFNAMPKRFDAESYATLSEKFERSLDPASTVSAAEQHKMIVDLGGMHSNPASAIQTYTKMAFGADKELPLLKSMSVRDALGELDKGLGNVDKSLLKLDGGLSLITAAKGELRAAVIDYASQHKGELNAKDFNAFLTAKTLELQNKIVQQATKVGPGAAAGPPPPPSARPGTTPAPGTPQAPGAPAQEGSVVPSPAAPKAPTSVANSIPIDRLVPVAADVARNPIWPEAQTTNANGTAVRTMWQPKDNLVPDMQDINRLRMNPYQAAKDGLPAWQKFDQIYGQGATRTFLTNSEYQIGLILNRLRQPQAQDEAAAARAAVANPLARAKEQSDIQSGVKQFKEEVDRQRRTPHNPNAQ